MFVSDNGTRKSRVLNMVNFFKIVKAMLDVKQAIQHWAKGKNRRLHI
jgi:hypothetical protein